MADTSYMYIGTHRFTAEHLLFKVCACSNQHTCV